MSVDHCTLPMKIKLAALRGDSSLLALELSNGGEPFAAEAIGFACQAQSPECLELLLACAPSKDSLGEALSCCVEGDGVECLEMLLAAGADPNAREALAARLACKSGKSEHLRLLALHGLDARASFPEPLPTLGHWSALRPSPACLEVLLSAGASPTETDLISMARRAKSARGLGAGDQARFMGILAVLEERLEIGACAGSVCGAEQGLRLRGL